MPELDIEALQARLARAYVLRSQPERNGKALVDVDFFAAIEDVKTLLAEVERLRSEMKARHCPVCSTFAYDEEDEDDRRIIFGSDHA